MGNGAWGLTAGDTPKKLREEADEYLESPRADLDVSDGALIGSMAMTSRPRPLRSSQDAVDDLVPTLLG